MGYMASVCHATTILASVFMGGLVHHVTCLAPVAYSHRAIAMGYVLAMALVNAMKDGLARHAKFLSASPSVVKEEFVDQ